MSNWVLRHINSVRSSKNTHIKNLKNDIIQTMKNNSYSTSFLSLPGNYRICITKIVEMDQWELRCQEIINVIEGEDTKNTVYIITYTQIGFLNLLVKKATTKLKKDDKIINCCNLFVVSADNIENENKTNSTCCIVLNKKAFDYEETTLHEIQSPSVGLSTPSIVKIPAIRITGKKSDLRINILAISLPSSNVNIPSILESIASLIDQINNKFGLVVAAGNFQANADSVWNRVCGNTVCCTQLISPTNNTCLSDQLKPSITDHAVLMKGSFISSDYHDHKYEFEQNNFRIYVR